MSCHNCGVELSGEFCGACGQRAIDPDPTLHEFLHEAAEELLHWDGKLASTFRLLIAKPGALTTEYLAGRRIGYISPLRLYLTCSVLFFFASALLPQGAVVTNRGREVSTQVGLISISEGDSVATIAALDTLAKHGRWVGRVWGFHFGNAMRHRTELRRDLTSAIPKTMFVLVPLFAALVGVVMYSRHRRYPQHLAFALHLHAFLFLALTVMLVRRLTSVTELAAVVQIAGLLAIAIYFAIALRRVYGGSRRSTILSAGAIGFIYFAAFLGAMVLTFGLIVLMQF
ncbi:MAG: DUF3667 domain-containing protein [Gemmatimonadota bacterium]|nr:DUF3667 domain-containing protein [Gemmatimonadota bacterium]